MQKIKVRACSCIIALFAAVIFSNCTIQRHHDFSLRNTLAIFLLNNGEDNFFCIPVQYLGDFQIQSFEFSIGYIQIGDYDISLNREEINISVYLNEAADESGNSDGIFDLIYQEETGKIFVSEMDEPLTIKNESDETMNHYYIFIERFLTNAEIKKITSEYEKGNIYSIVYIEYDITIDNELQSGSGMYDDFELYDGPAIDPVWFPENLDFFKAKYLQ